MAERRGVEPPIQCYPYNGLANRRLRPLGHLSAMKYFKELKVSIIESNNLQIRSHFKSRNASSARKSHYNRFEFLSFSVFDTILAIRSGVSGKIECLHQSFGSKTQSP